MGRPLLDVSDVLLDTDFCDTALVCIHALSGVNDQGMGFAQNSSFPFSGVVTSDKGIDLAREAIGEHGTGSISVITKFALRSGGPGVTADVVQWNAKSYTVVKVNDYSSYGTGFIEAICELLPLAG